MVSITGAPRPIESEGFISPTGSIEAMDSRNFNSLSEYPRLYRLRKVFATP
jgi:hypothetical protein